MGLTLVALALLAVAPTASPPVTEVTFAVIPEGGDAATILAEIRPKVASEVKTGAPLEPDGVTRAISIVYASGHFSQVTVRSSPTPNGIRLAFALERKAEVALIRVRGMKTMTESAAIAASKVVVGRDYFPELVPRAIRNLSEAYLRRGYQAARIVPRVAVDGTAAVIILTVDEGIPSLVRSIIFDGETGLPPSALLGAMKVRVGDRLDRARIEDELESVRSLFRRERYYRASVGLAHVSEDGRVVIPVVAGPRYDLVFSGNNAFSDTSLRAALRYTGAESLEASVIERLGQELQRFYRYRGFHDATVDASEVVRPGGTSAALGFSIVEGTRLVVHQYRFRGNAAISDAELIAVVARAVDAYRPEGYSEAYATSDPTDVAGRGMTAFAGALPQPSGDEVYDETSWAEALKAMSTLYRQRGYLAAEVKFVKLVVGDGGLARAEFSVREGPLRLLRSLSATGLPSGFTSGTIASVNRSRRAFSETELDTARTALVHELQQHAYTFAAAKSEWSVDAKGESVDATIQVDTGPQVRVGTVFITGNTHTADRVILNQVPFKNGDLLDIDALYRTQTSLISLGLFRSVQVEMYRAETPEAIKQIIITVTERPRYSTSFGFGYFLALGPRVVVDFGANNLGGQAINLTGHAEANFVSLSQPVLTRLIDLSDLSYGEQIGGLANVSLQSHSLVPANLGLRVDGVFDRTFRAQFRFNRAALIPSVDWTIPFEVPAVLGVHPSLTFGLQYELEWSWVERIKSSQLVGLSTTNLLDQQRLRFLFGSFVLQSAKFNITADVRDNSIVTHRGFLLQGNAEVTGALYARDEIGNQISVNFAKVWGLATIYVPLGPKVVLALSARGGRIFPLVPASVTPPVRRFYLGGSTSMRGFNEDQLLAEDLRMQYHGDLQECRRLVSKDGCTDATAAVSNGQQVPSQGGELFLLLKAELRVPVIAHFDVGFFYETGNLWLANPGYVNNLRQVVGGGLRYQSPIGIAALDVGVNLFPDVIINEPRWVLHFSIGLF